MALTKKQQLDYLLFLEERDRLEGSFSYFVKAAWKILEPTTTLVWNWHMETVCGYLQALYEDRLRCPRLIINIPFGTSKSLLASVMWHAWIWAKDPSRRFLASSNSDSLVIRDNNKVRSLVECEWFRAFWGEKVLPDKSQWDKRYFQNTKLGFREGVTFGSSVIGKRGDVQIIDDPTDASRAFSDLIIAETNERWNQGMVSRVNDMQRSMRLLIMQRLRTNDLTGHLLTESGFDWVHLVIPMEYKGYPTFDPVKDIGEEAAHLADPRTKAGEPLDPVRYPKHVLKALRKELGDYGWAGQMQQDPTPIGGGIIRKSWWVKWEDMHGWSKHNTGHRPAPLFKHVFWSWDTAFSTEDRKRNAFTAGTKWGLFWDEGEQRDKLMLLDRWHERVPFGPLKKRIMQASKKDTDAHLIERKGSGISVIQELRRNRKIKVRSYDPRPDGSKEERAHLCTAHFDAGMVVYPDRKWAQQLIELVAAFPTGAPPSADYTDTVTQAILYVIRRQWLRHPDDDVTYDDGETESVEEMPRKRFGTYG